ncbi:MAG TPA: autotransporter serine protease VvfC [Candidatus Helicobacter avicola]|nr:autotransporter serine protease VvfC [Candidatus Helicobacter avicola]
MRVIKRFFTMLDVIGSLRRFTLGGASFLATLACATHFLRYFPPFVRPFYRYIARCLCKVSLTLGAKSRLIPHASFAHHTQSVRFCDVAKRFLGFAYFLFLTLLASPSLYASALDPKFAYQYYLDFALNHGQFSPNASNLTIPAKDSSHNLTLLAPMPDFSAANLKGTWQSEVTNIGFGYAITAAHMLNTSLPNPIKIGSSLNFGGINSVVVDTLESRLGNNGAPADFAALKMSKLSLNTEAHFSPNLDFVNLKNTTNPTSFFDKYEYNEDAAKKLLDSNRYTLFAREGSGVQMIGYESQGATRIEGSNVYHTGGLLELRRVDVPFVLEMHAYDWDNANLRIPFGSSSAPGDSGSALYVYDNVDKSWYVVGVVSQSDCSGQTGDGCSYVYYTLVNDELIKEFKEPKSVFVGGGTYRFDNTGSLLDSSGMDLKASVISGSGAGENLWNSLFNKSAYDNRLSQMKDSKDLYFSDSGSLSLEKDIDLGAGVLVFGKDSSWSVSGTNNTNTWFLHGGIYADSGARITYEVSTKENDFLHKLGEGTLIVTSSSADAGLRIGQGLVELKGNDLSFKELYFVSGRGELKLENANNINTDYVYFGARGGKLDMNGQNLSFKRIYASDNGANIINSSPTTATLQIQNTQDYLYHGNIISDSGGINIESSTNQNLIFDGNINNANGKMTFSNGSLTFQGHPTIHAFVSEEVKEKLDSLNIGEGVFTSPTSFSQGDWEHRNFSLQSLKLENATFNLARNATLKTNIYATDSTLSLGTSTLWRDENDGENVSTALIATGNEQFYAGNEQYEGVGNDMKFNQSLKQGTIADSAKGQVLFVGDMHLSNSNANLNAMSFVGNIESNSGTSKLTITDSTLQGNITGTSTLSTQDSFISGVVSTSTLNANNTTFNLQVDVAKNTAQSLESTQSTSGGNNTLLLHLLNAPSSSTKLPSLLLASLQDSNKNLNKGYFSIPDIQDGFSIYTPNVAFTHEGDKAQWSLEQINVAQNSYFNISENTESTKRANALFNQVLLGYVIEWNNLQKRMGELRENPKAAGAWIRSFGGGSSDDKYRGNFFETQLGSDYQLDFNAGKI